MAIIIGTDGNDRYPDSTELKGTNLADQIYGLAGDDELVGFDGDDLLEGGAGADELWGGYGFDFASYQGSPAGVQVYLGSSYGADGGDAAGDHLYLIEGVIGSAFADVLVRQRRSQRPARRGRRRRAQWLRGRRHVHGGGGNDLISGSAGIDRLDGGDGDDWLDGGARRRRARGRRRRRHRQLREQPHAGVVADLASGTADGGDVGSDRLSGIENLEGTLYDDRLAGDGGANALNGAQGADVLVGRGGADRFVYDQTYDSTARGAGPHPRLQPQAGRPDRPFRRRRQRAGDRRPGVPVHRPGRVHRRRPGPLLQGGGDTVVEVNTDDATAGAEMRIEIDPLVNFQATDFVL